MLAFNRYEDLNMHMPPVEASVSPTTDDCKGLRSISDDIKGALLEEFEDCNTVAATQKRAEEIAKYLGDMINEIRHAHKQEILSLAAGDTASDVLDADATTDEPDDPESVV